MLNLLALLTLAKAEKSRPQRCETQRHRRRSQWRRQTATQTRFHPFQRWAPRVLDQQPQ